MKGTIMKTWEPQATFQLLSEILGDSNYPGYNYSKRVPHIADAAMESLAEIISGVLHNKVLRKKKKALETAHYWYNSYDSMATIAKRKKTKVASVFGAVTFVRRFIWQELQRGFVNALYKENQHKILYPPRTDISSAICHSIHLLSTMPRWWLHQSINYGWLKAALLETLSFDDVTRLIELCAPVQSKTPQVLYEVAQHMNFAYSIPLYVLDLPEPLVNKIQDLNNTLDIPTLYHAQRMHFALRLLPGIGEKKVSLVEHELKRFNLM